MPWNLSGKSHPRPSIFWANRKLLQLLRCRLSCLRTRFGRTYNILIASLVICSPCMTHRIIKLIRLPTSRNFMTEIKLQYLSFRKCLRLWLYQPIILDSFDPSMDGSFNFSTRRRMTSIHVRYIMFLLAISRNPSPWCYRKVGAFSS